MAIERHTGPNPIEEDTTLSEAVVRVELKAKISTITSHAASDEDMGKMLDALTDAMEALGWEVDVQCTEICYG